MSRRWQRPKPDQSKQQTLFGGAAGGRQRAVGGGAVGGGDTAGTLPANESKTSRAAAVAMRRASGGQLARVLQYVVMRGSEGATNEEIAGACEIKLQSVCARTNDLAKRGLIRDSGRERKTSSGHNARVWIAEKSTG